MSDTTTVGEIDAEAMVPSVGFVLAGLALAAMLLPVRRGVESPVLLAGVALAGVSLCVFLVRRHGGLPRSIGGAVAAVSSLGLLLLSGYALNQGVLGGLSVPVIGSVPLVFGAFLAAAGAVCAATADYFAIPPDRLRDQSTTTAALSVVGVAALLSFYVWTFVLAVPAFLLLDGLSDVVAVVLSQIGMALGTATVAVAYFLWSDREWSFIDLRVPSLRDLAWTVGGFVILFGALIAISQLLTTAGVENAEHSTSQQAAENPEILLVLIPAAFLVIGPCEELLYRNVVQKSLYGVFSRYGAVVVGSAIFAAVHVLAYSTSGIGAVLASLGVIFGLSLVLGGVYERTDNLVVPILIHGTYNAVLYANMYFSYA